MTKQYNAAEEITGVIATFIVWMVTLRVIGVPWLETLWVSWAICATIGLIYHMLTEDKPRTE